jgi:hypothetical protein
MSWRHVAYVPFSMTPRLSPLHCMLRPSVYAALLRMGLGASFVLCGLTSKASAQARRAPVPAVAPDAIPDWVYADSNIVSDSMRAPIPYAANVLWVEFTPEATTAQRQQAVDAVAAIVVGGKRSAFGEGIYLLRVEAGGAFAPLAAAVDSLNTMPQVVWALYSSFVDRRIQRPHRTVPAVAPDSIPRAVFDSLTAPANLLRNPPGVTGLVVRNALYVRFHDGVAQEDRQKAIDAINAEVLGGVAPPFSFYIVRIPATAAPGDSTPGPLMRAYRALLTFPSVRGVVPLFIDGQGYSRPPTVQTPRTSQR